MSHKPSQFQTAQDDAKVYTTSVDKEVVFESIRKRAKRYSIFSARKIAWIDETLTMVAYAKQSRKP